MNRIDDDMAGAPAGSGPGPHARGGVIEFSTRRRVTVAMVTVSLLLFGLLALGNLKVNLLPDLSFPTLTVRTEYTGAAPSEIETLVSQPVEEALGVVKGLRKMKSVSRTGQSDVVLEFAWGTDMDQAGLEVRDKLETLQLPLEVAPPVVLRFNPSTEPILRVALSATGEGDAVRQLTGLRRYADDDLKKKLEPVTGVAAVRVGGGLEDEIQVELDIQMLARIGLPIDNVIQRLKQENVNLSGGRLEQGTQRYLVRTVNQFADVEEIRGMLVATQSAASSGGGGADEVARIAAASGDAAVMAAPCACATSPKCARAGASANPSSAWTGARRWSSRSTKRAMRTPLQPRTPCMRASSACARKYRPASKSPWSTTRRSSSVRRSPTSSSMRCWAARWRS